MSCKVIFFTDLDGSLLDSGYSFREALPALKVISKMQIPLILCSSKTREEIEHIRKKLSNNHPFVTENGGGIFIPQNYFKYAIRDTRYKINDFGGYHIIKLGTSYPDLRKALLDLRLEGFDVTGFGDMSLKQIVKLTGLKTSDARMAKHRDLDEPFVFKGSSASLSKLKKSILSKGLRFTRGVFFHLTGDNDKGRAVDILKNLYMKQNGRIISAAFGDSQNDAEMLERVDHPVVVKKADGTYDPDLIRRLKNHGELSKTHEIGPAGWNKAVLRLLDL
jgi:mannosyl-3-phosphoglycerate phosphatase